MQYDHRVMGEVIRLVRKQKRKSQEVVSGLAGIDRTHLAKIEMGRHSASTDTLWKIAEALEMRPSELFRMVEDAIAKEQDQE